MADLSRKRFHSCGIARWFVKSPGGVRGAGRGPVQRGQNRQRAFGSPLPSRRLSGTRLCSPLRLFGRKLLRPKHCHLRCDWSRPSGRSEPISSPSLQGKGTGRGPASPLLLSRSRPRPEFRGRRLLVGGRCSGWRQCPAGLSDLSHTAGALDLRPPRPEAWRGCVGNSPAPLLALRLFLTPWHLV